MIKRLLVSGYKNHELGIWDNKHPGIGIIKIAIEKQLRLLLDEELVWIITGGQPGVEQWTSEVVLDLKNEYPQLKLAILLPYLEYEKNWNEEKQEHYQSILEQADFVDVVSKKPYTGPWQLKARTKFVLDNTDAALLLYDEEKEGSPKFLKEDIALRSGTGHYPLLTINSYDLQTIAEDEQEKLRTDW